MTESQDQETNKILTPDQIVNLHCRIADLEKQLGWDRLAARSVIESLSEAILEESESQLHETIKEKMDYLRKMILE